VEGGVLYTPTNLDALTRNLQKIKVNHAEQPAKNRATPYRTQVLPLLHRRGCSEHILKNVCMCKVFNP